MTAPVIVTRNLTRRFGSFVAVDDVSFEVKPGEIFGYLGANGAGKSTTIRMLCGLLAPTSGVAEVNGIDVAHSPEGVKRSIGYMSQKFSLYHDLLVEENLEFFGGTQGLMGKKLRERIDYVLDRVALTEHKRTRTGALPGGLRQRIALASSLLHSPKIVFLDEPTAGVDPDARRNFWSLIRELSASGTTVFVTTHYMDEAENCHRIGLMVDGKLVALDTPSALKAEHVPGKLVKVEGRGASRALPIVRAIPGVHEAHPFGAALHVRYSPERLDPRAIHAQLAAQSLGGLVVTPMPPTLEDVFLAVVEGH
ncbi:ABC transporter ATP-binding protein [Myxococcota bacterium]|nr:ABC transporter ATP-binding protein [Myxococcota bacterium]